MPRACLQVFTRINQQTEHHSRQTAQYTVLMSVVQLFDEKIQVRPCTLFGGLDLYLPWCQDLLLDPEQANMCLCINLPGCCCDQ